MMRFFAPILAALFVLCALATPAAAQDSVISNLPSAASLTGAETAPLDQGTCPGSPPTCTTVHTTLTAIKTWIAPGSVTSVTVTTPTEITNSGCAITASGTCALTWATESANRVFAGPTTGSAATPTFRALVAADIPSLSASYDAAGAAATAQSTAESFSANAANITSNSLACAQTPIGGTCILTIAVANVASTGDVGSVAVPAGIGDFALAPSNATTAGIMRAWSNGASGAVTTTIRSAALGAGSALYTFTSVVPPASTAIARSTAAATTGLFNSSTTTTLYANQSASTATGTGNYDLTIQRLP